MIIEQSDIWSFSVFQSSGKRLTEIKENLVSDTKSILNWFRLNSLKANPGTVSVHQRHLTFLMTETYKSISQLNPEFMWFFSTHKDIPYHLRKGPILGLPKTDSFYYGTNAIHFRGSLIRNNLPAVVKSSDSLF